MFCLVLHQRSLRLESEFQALYLDDVTLGGNCKTLAHDIQVMRDATDLGLSLNAAKCEIVCDDMATCGSLLVALPGAKLVSVSQAHLLGSLIGDDKCITAALTGKVEDLQRLGERLQLLSAHDALILLPRLLYTLRTAPCFRSATLETYPS